MSRKTMPNGSLNDYIRTQLQRGYPPESIRYALIQAGYNPQDIDYALRLYGKTTRRIELTGKNLALAVGSLLTIVLLAVTGFIIFSPGPKDIQVALRVEQPSLLPGGTLQVETTLTSEQSRETPVALNYLVSQADTRKTVTSRSERVRVGKSAYSSLNVPLPETLAPGDYEVKLVAQYEGLTRVQTSRFSIQQPIQEEAPIIEEPAELEPIELECTYNCDDLNPATTDSCVQGSCVHTTIDNVCGNAACEEGETRLSCPEDCGTAQDKNSAVNQALQTAEPEKAATICNTLVLPEDSDACFAAIANKTRKSALCNNIQDSRTHDNCLMDFAFQNDYTVCPQLNNRYLLTSCQSLARFSTIPQEQAEAEALARQIEQEAQSEE